jgi:hypothetical protein
MKKILIFLFFSINTISFAQEVKVTTKDNDLKLDALPYYSFGKGVGITSPDSLFQLNIRFRMQNRVTFIQNEVKMLHIRERLDDCVCVLMDMLEIHIFYT